MIDMAVHFYCGALKSSLRSASPLRRTSDECSCALSEKSLCLPARPCAGRQCGDDPRRGKPPVRIGRVNWSDTEITVKLASTALQEHLKQPVKLVMADIGIQFQALA